MEGTQGSPDLSLHWADYAVFSGMLLISLGIGIYHSFTGGKQKTTSEYILGNRQMKLWPTTLSMMVSYVSSILLLGFPAEMYGHGVQQWTSIIGVFLGGLFGAIIFVPVLYPLQLTSVNMVSFPIHIA